VPNGARLQKRDHHAAERAGSHARGDCIYSAAASIADNIGKFQSFVFVPATDCGGLIKPT
jgi:hypothetical protein